MADRREDLNHLQIGSSWIPTTPAMPYSTETRLIYTNGQEKSPTQANWVEPDRYTPVVNHVTQANLSGSGKLPGDFPQETQFQRVRPFYSSANLVGGEAANLCGADTWQAGRASSSSYIYGGEDSHIYDNNYSLKDSDSWSSMSFGSLLALAHATNVVSRTDFVGTSSSYVPRFYPETSFGSFSSPDMLGSKSAAKLNTMSDILNGHGSSIPSRPFLDLNSPPRTISYAALSKGSTSSQFQPITPEKTNKVEGLNEKKENSEMVNNQVLLEENHKPDKGGTEEGELIKTPQQKPRRKRHRPKVIIEGKAKRGPKPRVDNKPDGPQETPTPAKRKYVRRKQVDNLTNTPSEGGTTVEKRKYVRRKKIEKTEVTTTNEGTPEKTETNTTIRRTRSSCRRTLNFDSEGQVLDESSNCPPSNCNSELQANNFNAIDHQSILNVQVEKTDIGIAYELTRSANKVLQDYLSRPEWQSPRPSPHANTDPTFREQILRTRGKCQLIFSDATHDKEVNTVQMIMNPDKSPSDSVCASTCLIQETRGLKRQHVGTTVEEEAEPCNNSNASGSFYNSMQAYSSIFSQNADKNNEGTSRLQFPAIYKKKRTEKGQNMATTSSSWHTATTSSDNHVNFERHPLGDSYTTNQGSSSAQWKATGMLPANYATDNTQNGRQIFEDLLALGPTEKIRRKRSKGPTRLRDLSSLLEICKEFPPGTEASTSRIEALLADTRSTMTTKKRSKRSPLMNSTGGQQLAITWNSMSTVDSIVEQLNKLDLNAKTIQASAQRNAFMAYHTHYQDQYALVPYQRGGAVVPFDSSFDQVRRRRPRPKVNLDDETTRVWKLLLENINSEGIDGTDEEKSKWWEEERRIFNGRADSFIARMHLVQGDRRFSPWKGSVVDSVVGVFLTQNVSDHLSSSAFMSMAARFPLESKSHPEELHEDRLDTKMKEPEVIVLDSDDEPSGSNKVVNKSVGDEHTKILQEFEDYIREVDNVKSTENSSDDFTPKDTLRSQSPDSSNHGPVISSLIGDGRDTEDALCSQTSEISSQNSTDSPIAQTIKRSESCLPSTSEEEPTAGVKPNNKFTSSTSFVKLLQMAGTVIHGVYENGSDKRMSDENDQVESESSALELHFDRTKFTEKSVSSCSKSSLGHAPNSQSNSKFLASSTRKELCSEEISGLSSDSASKTTGQIEMSRKRAENQTGQVSAESLFQENNCKIPEVSKVPSNPQNCVDVTGSSSNIDNPEKSERKEVNSNKNDLDYSHPGKTVDGPKSKGVRPGKQKQKPVDWDHLRKQAQPGGRKREKSANTMDSVDWDAVRCADVNDIAQTIKERGMNNMLAERIKAFLNRLVTDHGSIDLEWLRDVPPDKAKEYLLSFRGLGLKSVECVRLLTLHHLAFPVDTNVGRIAVRLGWVPLQPLPESLQLHLLELYPVLESIQKYLWPRLCKLDQRTLYELHYQMITFGKVFCTKSKPNCNACPMRAECRHFASAFASARLALPAPEEKSIVSATENKTAGQNQNPMASMNTLQLPSPPANHMDAKSGISNSQPIIEEPSTPETVIEVPATPEPIIEVPATPEPSYTQIPECDIENSFDEDPDEIPTIQLNMEEFTHNLQKIMQEGDMSKALVALTSEAASIPVPKLKNVSGLRTEHQVYELPDSHPLLEGMDKREPDDPSPYLLAIWTPGETVDSIQLPEKRCSSQESEKLCTDETCSSCNSIREANSQTVRGTLLIPCRTAMRGSFPLNGTYFQVNEVFADHEGSLSPMDVPRQWLWNLPRRTVYFGTSIPTIFKGLSTEGIQYCFWRGFVCVRGFDRKTRAPRPLIARMHFPASRLAKGKGKMNEN